MEEGACGHLLDRLGIKSGDRLVKNSHGQAVVMAWEGSPGAGGRRIEMW